MCCTAKSEAKKSSLRCRALCPSGALVPHAFLPRLSNALNLCMIRASNVSYIKLLFLSAVSSPTYTGSVPPGRRLPTMCRGPTRQGTN